MLFLSLENGDSCLLIMPDGSTGHVTRTPNGIAFHLDDDIVVRRSELMFDFAERLPDGFLPSSRPVFEDHLVKYWDAMIVRAANEYDIRKTPDRRLAWFIREEGGLRQFCVGVRNEEDDSIMTYAWEINPERRPRRIG